MSRTDAHTPLWVIEKSPWWYLDFYESHDHRFAACDLHSGAPERERACRLYFNGLRRVCSCDMCGRSFSRRYNRSQERVRWRTIRQSILAAVDRSDVDVPGIRGTVY